MTVKEFVQGMMLVFCMIATGVVLPIGLVAGSASHDAGVAASSTEPVFIFEDAR